jgi:ribosomal protein S18 acetylase RimI-like enzyme
MIPYSDGRDQGRASAAGGTTMTSTTLLAEPVTTPLCRALHPDQAWETHRAHPADVEAVKALFRRLHAFNTALDARFALSEGWEPLFDAAMRRALHDGESICLVAREAQTGVPCAFILAAVHRDSDMWRHREWVEVEALYVDDAWHGRGLAEALLDRVCAWAEGVGQPTIQLYVTASNERAIRFYQHAGFRTTQEIMRKVLA